MKTKVGLPFGLALALFIGVFTAMLALGVISPSGVQGADQPVNVGGYRPGRGLHYWRVMRCHQHGAGNRGHQPVPYHNANGVRYRC